MKTKLRFYLNAIAVVILGFSLLSCGTEEPLSLNLSVSANNVTVGNAISFMATSSEGGDVTNESVIYVNNVAIQGNSFTPAVANQSNTAYATWNGITSNTVTFSSQEEVIELSEFTQKVMMEDYTGTWCGYCPGMANVMHHLTTYSPNVIPVAIHCDGDDPYRINTDIEDLLQSTYQTNGLPKARINRTHKLDYVRENGVPDNCGTKEQEYINLVQPYLAQTAKLGLAINTSLSGNNLNMQVKVGFAVDQLENAKLVVYLLEDGLIYEQNNYLSGTNTPNCQFSSQPRLIPNYEHNHVLRRIYTDAFGDVIPTDKIKKGGIYQKDFAVTLPTGIQNTNNLSVVAFVMGTSANDVQNVQSVKVGENKDFD